MFQGGWTVEPNTISARKNGDLWLIEDERENMKVSYRIKEVVFSEKSPFQHVMILDSYDFRAHARFGRRGANHFPGRPHL